MRLQHPDNTGRPIEVDADRAKLLKANGWVEVKAHPDPKPDPKK